MERSNVFWIIGGIIILLGLEIMSYMDGELVLFTIMKTLALAVGLLAVLYELFHGRFHVKNLLWIPGACLYLYCNLFGPDFGDVLNMSVYLLSDISVLLLFFNSEFDLDI